MNIWNYISVALKSKRLFTKNFPDFQSYCESKTVQQVMEIYWSLIKSMGIVKRAFKQKDIYYDVFTKDSYKTISKISSMSGVPKLVIIMFFKVIFDEISRGQIKIGAIDPKLGKEIEDIKKKTNPNIFDLTADIGRQLLLTGSIIGISVLIYNLKKGRS